MKDACGFSGNVFKAFVSTRRPIGAAVLLALGLGIASSAHAVVLPAVEDAYLDIAAGKSVGSDRVLKVSPNHTAFVRFDLKGLPEDLSIGDVEKATVLLRVSGVSTPGAVDVYPLVAPTVWSEQAILAGYIGSRVGGPIAVSAQTTYVMVDVTEVVMSWIASGAIGVPNVGLVMFPAAGSPATAVEFESREGGNFGALLDVTLSLIGPKGAKGATGATGAAGVTGATGATGAAGVTGAIGAAGAAGVTGAMGATGATGAMGIVGPSGATGAAGATGAVGANGANGANGAPGLNGVAGPNGVNGNTGANGPAGVAGPKGDNGAKGDRGDNGNAGGYNTIFHRSTRFSGTSTPSTECNSGEVASGGGVSSDYSGDGLTLLASAPSGRTGWSAQFNMSTSGTIWVICLK